MRTAEQVAADNAAWKQKRDAEYEAAVRASATRRRNAVMSAFDAAVYEAERRANEAWALVDSLRKELAAKDAQVAEARAALDAARQPAAPRDTEGT